MRQRPKISPFEPGWKQPAEPLEFSLSEEFHQWHEGPKKFVLDGLLALEECSVVFGDPDAGKGNFATTLACAVAGGQKFFGRDAGWFTEGEWKPCGVVYFALERFMQVRRRIKAYEQEHGAPYHLPIAVCSEQFDIREEATADLLAETLFSAHSHGSLRLAEGPGAADFDPDFNLVIIDTLAMALQGGSDSDPGDMGRAIHTVKRLMEKTEAHVMLIHHSPVSGDGRMRGYGSLNAAIDVSIRVEQKKMYRVASVLKNSDSPDNPRFYYHLKGVDVPHWHGDKHGEPVGEPFNVSVPLLLEMDAPPSKEAAGKAAKKPSGPRPSKAEQPVYDALVALQEPVTEDDWRAAYDATPVEGVSPANHRTRFWRGKDSLVKKGLIQNNDNLWSVTELASQENL